VFHKNIKLKKNERGEEMILAIDPGMITGYALGVNKKLVEYGIWNTKVRNRTKKMAGQPKYYRIYNFHESLSAKLIHLPPLCRYKNYSVRYVLCEDALGFQRGRAAVEVSHKFRAIVELVCCKQNLPLTYIQPYDLKRFATGKATADKGEMIRAAAKYGYEGNDDNVADAIHLLFWGFNFLE